MKFRYIWIERDWCEGLFVNIPKDPADMHGWVLGNLWDNHTADKWTILVKSEEILIQS